VKDETPPPTWIGSRRAFLAALGFVYLLAFGSLWAQLDGLYGSRGIAPIADLMERARAALSGAGRLELPTLFWFGASDGLLHATCLGGVLVSLLLIAGVLPRVSAALAWTLYLAFVAAGRPFLPFQWDALLLEAGLLAAFYAPGGLLPYRSHQRAPSPVVRFLLGWLLFRLMFQSGLVKLQSGDAVWRDLTALDYHYWTQPLPHVLSVYADRLPALVDKACLVVMFAIELVAPFLLIAPRRVRHGALLSIVLLMALIAATGNYGFFNLLTVVLCLPLLDDRALERLTPFLPWLTTGSIVSGERTRRTRLLRGVAVVLAAAVVLQTVWQARWIEALPAPVERTMVALSRCYSFNRYGLFANMTEDRPEVVIEGSEDGRTWERYAFRWKPGALDRRPGFAGPHMPRLDWQMWFVTFQGGRPPDWFDALLARLLEASPPVLALLEDEPFDGRPPRAVRAAVYHYRFAPDEARREGRWWVRKRVGPFAAKQAAPTGVEEPPVR
jgi:hypothetical protein